MGEREIVQRLTSRFASEPALPLGFEDDVAVFPFSSDKWIVLKSDMLVGSTDVPPGMTSRQAARKAIVATVSDFAAKGVQPYGFLISLGLTPPVRSSAVNEVAKGLAEGAREYGCRIIGGDTAESEDFVIDCVAFGFTEPNKIIRRDGARPGDIVAVTGQFGKSAGGLRILVSKKKALARRFPKLVKSVLHPVARLNDGIKLAKTRSVNSSIDSSDGLAWSLHEIARLSCVSIHLDNIPIAREAEIFAKQQRLIATDLALYGGEEYEIVLTVDHEKFASAKRRVPSLIRIGQVRTGDAEVTASLAGRVIEIEARGWEHLSKVANCQVVMQKSWVGRRREH